MQPRQFDLRGLKAGFGPRVTTAPYQGGATRPSWRRRLALYALAVLIIAGALGWQRGQLAGVQEAVAADLATVADEFDGRAVPYLVASSADPRQLARDGMEALKAESFSLASYCLQAASQKDPQFRDAAVYAGFAELARADTAWTRDAELARAHTKAAVRYLSVAQAIDPIHAYTFELLAIAHGNLGETDLAAVAQSKAERFALSSAESQPLQR